MFCVFEVVSDRVINSDIKDIEFDVTSHREDVQILLMYVPVLYILLQIPMKFLKNSCFYLFLNFMAMIN